MEGSLGVKGGTRAKLEFVAFVEKSSSNKINIKRQCPGKDGSGGFKAESKH